MALTDLSSYAGLRDAIAGWLNRADLVDQIPAFVQLFEAQFNTDPRGRVQDSVVIATADIADELTPVPVDYIQMQNLRIPGSVRAPGGLDLLTPQKIGAFKPLHVNPGEPLYYAIIGRQLRLLPTPDVSYTFEMEYFAKLPALSDDDSTNWLLESRPGIYLYGSLLQAEPYLKNDERIAVWQGLYNALMEDLNTTDDRALLSGATLKMRTRSFG